MSTATLPSPQSTDPLDHQGLVHAIALMYRGKGIPLDDLIQEGELGLLRACRGFDPSRGVKFATYATHWIRCYIRSAILDQRWPVRLPRYIHQAILDGEAPKTTKRRACLAAAKRAQTMQTAGSADLAARDMHLADLAIAETDDHEGLESLEMVRQIVAGLPDRNKTILTLRFGLDGDEPRTLSQIGRDLGVTRERVRQIQNETLASIRGRLEAAC